MKLIDQLRRQPLHISFGRGPGAAAGTITPVALDSTRDADSVTITADDGSFVVVPGATGTTAGVLTAGDKDRIDALAGGSGGALFDFETRAAAIAASIPAFQEFLRTAGYYAAGDGGGGLYRRVTTLPGHSLTLTTADGAFWELVPEHGVISVRQAGARGDGTTDDSPAFMAAISAFTDYNGDDDTGITIIVPPVRPHYRCATTLNIKHRIRLKGHGFYDDRYPQIIFDDSVAGIVVNNAESLNVSDRPGPTSRATWSWIEGLAIKGRGSNPDAHGFVLRAKVRMRDCMASHFGGNGFHMAASSNESQGQPFGNVNHSLLVGITAAENHGHGMFVAGFDSNAMSIIGLDARSNGRFGLWEQSFLGNTYIGAHFDANGIPQSGANSASQSCLCSFGGNRYAAHYNATELELRTVQPGTDPNVWRFAAAGNPGTRYLEWTASNEVGRFHAGGPVTFTGLQNRGTISGYVEPLQGGAHFNARTTWIGGHIDASDLPVYGSGKVERGSLVLNGGQIYQFQRDGENSSYDVRIREGGDDRMIAFLRGNDKLEWYYDTADNTWKLGTSRGGPNLSVTAGGHSYAAGRQSTLPTGRFIFHDGVHLGPPDSDGRQMTFGAGAPTTGAWAQGDVVFSAAPVAGGQVGWVCVASGSPGTWKTFGAIEA